LFEALINTEMGSI